MKIQIYKAIAIIVLIITNMNFGVGANLKTDNEEYRVLVFSDINEENKNRRVHTTKIDSDENFNENLSEFDAMLLDIEYFIRRIDFVKEMSDAGKPVMFIGDISVEKINTTLEFMNIKIETGYNQEKDIKAFYISNVSGIPYICTVFYSSGVKNTKTGEIDKIDIDSVHNVYGDIIDMIEDIRIITSEINDLKSNRDIIDGYDIKSLPPGPVYLMSTDVKLYAAPLVGWPPLYVARIRCPIIVTGSQYSNYTIWDIIGQMQAIPQESFVRVENYKTRLGVPFNNQDWWQYTNIANNASQTVSLSMGEKPTLSWSTDVSGYNVGIVGSYDKAVEWRVTRRFLTDNSGLMQSIEPGLRTVNYSGSATFRRWYYGEFRVRFSSFNVYKYVSPEYYYYSTITLADR